MKKYIVEGQDIRAISDCLSELIHDADARAKTGRLAKFNYDRLCSEKKYRQRFSEIFME